MLHPQGTSSAVWNGFGALIKPSVFASFQRVTHPAWRFARDLRVQARWNRFAAHNDEIPWVGVILKRIAWPDDSQVVLRSWGTQP